MISTEAAGLAIAIAKGLIKLGSRMDRLLAEKVSVEGSLIIPMPPRTTGPDRETRIDLLRAYLTQTVDAVPDPLAGDRKRLQALLAKQPVPDESDLFFERLFPEQASPPAVSPDLEYLKALRQWLPTVNWSDPNHPEVCQAAFYIASGRDERGLTYPARLALLVVDVLAEFGAEHTQLFVRDRNVQTIVKSVLERFSAPDLESFDEWSPFLRHTLNATLNGLLEAQSVFAEHAQWVNALLQALALARSQAEDPDNYLLGLLQGRGYSLLVGEGMQIAAQQLSAAQAGLFSDLVADFLVTLSPLVKANKKGFGDFFREHWGDLLRGGLSATARYGPALLEGKSPLLAQTLLAMATQLAATPDTGFFTTDTVFHLAEAALGAVARNPKLLKGSIGEEWLRTLIVSVAGTLSDSGLRSAFSRNALERIVKDTLAAFAQHPELIIAEPGLARDILGATLQSVAQSKSLEVWPLANAAVSGALSGLAQHPELAGSKYGSYVAQLAAELSQVVAQKGLPALLAADIAAAAAETMLRNPELFARSPANISAGVVTAVLDAAGSSQLHLLEGVSLVLTVRDVMAAVGRYGMSFVENNGAKDLVLRLTSLLAAGVQRAEKELGRRLDQPAVPAVLAALVRKWLRGELAELDPDSENFKKLFSEIAETVAA